ncbi:MAG: efflux transporter outer membrane subunit [Bacteroidetes bacterium]|nr:efflux transporter outer membrane subunit [Bacteroidota bacterium]
MKEIRTIFFGFVAVCFLLISCKTAKITETNNIKAVPTSFMGVMDSSNSAGINWKEYFSDGNLIALIDTALVNNLDVLMSLQKIEVAGGNARLSRGALWPVLSGNISTAQRKYGLYTMDGAGNITTEITPGKIVPTHLPDHYLGLQTSWEIDVWGKLRNKRKAALARYLESIEGKNWLITNLITGISTAYYELLELDNQLEIIRETIKLQQTAIDIVNAQREAGTANELAVKQFKAELLNTKALEFETLQQITEFENKINFLLGRYPQTVNRDGTELNKALSQNIKIGIPSDLLKNRPDIREAEYELLASKADVKSAKLAFYPSLNIAGSMGFQAFNSTFLFTSPQSIAYTLLGNLTAPLINRSAIQAEFKTAKANQLNALYNYQKTIINGYVEVYNELANIKSLEQINEIKTEQAEILIQSIETSTDLFKTGRANYLEVLNAQQKALQTKLELVNTKKRQYNATVNIYKALGGGWR